MEYGPREYGRRSIRMGGYDYRWPGAYFVTICTGGGESYFADHRAKAVAEVCWRETATHFPKVELDAFVIMPNHVHGIIILQGGASVGAGHALPLQVADGQRGFRRVPSGSLHTIVASFKSACSRRIRREGESSFGWQRNYWERVIRDEDELNRIRQYIRDNPLSWGYDRENPRRVGDRGYEREWGWLHGGTACRAPTKRG